VGHIFLRYGQYFMKINDPLSEVTRKERRALLGVSALGMAMSATGLIPTKISALGIEFPPAEQASFVWAIMGVILFYLIAFMVYAWSDYITWKIELQEWVIEQYPPFFGNQDEEEMKSQYYEDEAYLIYLEQIEDAQRVEDYENLLIHNQVKSALEYQYKKQKDKIPLASKLRAIFEFALPVVIGVSAIIILITTTDIKQKNTPINPHKKIVLYINDT